MESRIILLDSSVLIDYFRKTQKDKSFFLSLTAAYDTCAVSVISQFEVYVGSRPEHKLFWDKVFEAFLILPLDTSTITTALSINEQLKRQRMQIAFPDLLIAATAQTHRLPIATLNVKHFERIDGLTVINQ